MEKQKVSEERCWPKLKAEISVPCKGPALLITAALYGFLSWKNITVHIHFMSGLESFLSLNTISLTINIASKVETFSLK